MKTLSRCFLSAVLLTAFAGTASLYSCETTCSTTCSTDSSSCTTSCTNCTTMLIGRSSHNNDAFFGLNPYMYIPEVCEFNTGFILGYEYQSTFGSSNLANCIVGGATTPTASTTSTTTTTTNSCNTDCTTSCGNRLLFQGSKVTNRVATALIADNFGLSQVFDGSIVLNPQIQSNNLHFQWYLGFDNWVEGLYTTFDLTFSNQKRSLFSSCNTSCGTTTTDTSSTATPVQFPVGYMDDVAVNSSKSIQEALSGDFLFGDMQTKWAFGRWSTCDLKDNKVAGFSINLGYNFWNCEDSHLGAFIRYTAPTGTNIQAGSQKYGNNFFAPVIGNGFHHELGGGLHMHKELWANDCGDAITLFINGYATHLFNSCQFRSFDFKDKGCTSRYMLLKELTLSNGVYSYAGNLINAINYATRPVDASFDVQGAGSARFIYKHNNFSMALGYEIFGRSQEKLCLKTGTVCNAVDTTKLYGFKGCNGVAYYSYPITGGLTTGGTTGPVSLNATGSAATIVSCGATTANPLAGTDNATTTLTGTTVGVAWNNLYDSTSLVAANAVPTGTATTAVTIAQTSVNPVLVSTDLLDINSGKAPRIVTNKGFVTFDYVWEDFCWAPSLGIGGEVEGGGKSCDIRQWGVWIRGGLGF